MNPVVLEFLIDSKQNILINREKSLKILND